MPASKRRCSASCACSPPNGSAAIISPTSVEEALLDGAPPGNYVREGDVGPTGCRSRRWQPRLRRVSFCRGLTRTEVLTVGLRPGLGLTRAVASALAFPAQG